MRKAQTLILLHKLSDLCINISVLSSFILIQSNLPLRTPRYNIQPDNTDRS